jgi:enterochelin esterase-like enzyme
MQNRYFFEVKLMLVLGLIIGLIGCAPPARTARARGQESERNFSPLARELTQAFRETNAYERGDKLVALMANMEKEGKSLSSLFEEIASQPAKAGWDVRRLTVAPGEVKRVNVYIPDNYDPTTPTPVVMCYHWSGGDGFGMINSVKTKLKGVVDDFILVGPDNIGPYNIDSQRSWKAETRMILKDLRSRYNVDSDRVYAAGFSLGGYAVWSNAAYFGDEFAAGISMGASFDAAPEVPGMWEALLPNTKDTPVLYAWGDQDQLQVYGLDLTTPVGTIGKFNPRLTEFSKKNNLPHEAALVRGVGHVFDPPIDRAKEFLSKKRSQPPKEIHRAFRTQNQGRAFWVEAIAADGPQWHYEGVPLSYDPPETKEQAIARVLLPLLARIDAKREGNVMTVDTKGIGDLALWFTEDMIDWEQPVKVIWNGKEVFNSRIEKSDGVCLLQYVRTRDRQRLYWGGVRLSKRTGANAITIKEDVPNVIAPLPYKQPAT